MLTPIAKNFRGLITITGPSRSGKSQLAEFLIKEQASITYIATSKPRVNDPEWNRRIRIHRSRRPNCWKLIEHPVDVCKTIESLDKTESILLDSLGGLVEQQLMNNEDQWDSFQSDFINCLNNNDLAIVVVTEEVGWGIVPSTPVGHLYRERLTNFSTALCRLSSRRWLAVNGTAIDLDNVGYPIP